MITIEEVIDLTGLSRDEIDAIAEHEHIPEAAAAALADYLMHQEKGVETVRGMIEDDIRRAIEHGDEPHAATLLATLRRFMTEHALR